MIYGDDQCVECGGIRAAGSNLCVNCLVRRLDAEMKEILIKRGLIELLHEKIDNLKGQLNDALHYGFRMNQENAHLRRKLDEAMDDIHGPDPDDK